MCCGRETTLAMTFSNLTTCAGNVLIGHSWLALTIFCLRNVFTAWPVLGTYHEWGRVFFLFSKRPFRMVRGIASVLKMVGQHMAHERDLKHIVEL